MWPPLFGFAIQEAMDAGTQIIAPDREWQGKPV